MSQAETALVAGQVQGVVGFYDHTSTCRRKGKCRGVRRAVLARRPARWRSSPPSAAATSPRPQDFKGKKLGVTGLGSSTDFLTQYLAVKNGVKVSDYTTGRRPARARPSSRRSSRARIDAGMTTDPTVATASTEGPGQGARRHAHRGGHPGGARRPVPAASLYMRLDYVNGHKRRCRSWPTRS